MDAWLCKFFYLETFTLFYCAYNYLDRYISWYYKYQFFQKLGCTRAGDSSNHVFAVFVASSKGQFLWHEDVSILVGNIRNSFSWVQFHWHNICNMFFAFDLIACDCSVNGTVPDICNNMTSNCLCKESNTGTQCSECSSGYYRNINSNTTECQGIFSV